MAEITISGNAIYLDGMPVATINKDAVPSMREKFEWLITEHLENLREDYFDGEEQ